MVVFKYLIVLMLLYEDYFRLSDAHSLPSAAASRGMR